MRDKFICLLIVSVWLFCAIYTFVFLIPVLPDTFPAIVLTLHCMGLPYGARSMIRYIRTIFFDYGGE